jgi:excisionase family DNA binding protein
MALLLHFRITETNWEIGFLPEKGISMKHFRDEVLKADEVSRWLRIPKSTIYKLCLEGQIPGTKIGRHWRFDRKDIEVWFKNRIKNGKWEISL